VIRFYLDIPVVCLDLVASGEETEPPAEGWIWAQWPDGRRFQHWADQLTATPWEGTR
jgi:hypothetical protein